jgi:hypothetical protein
MRFAICLLAILALSATGQIGSHVRGGAGKVSAAIQGPPVQADDTPKIINARLSGKKLFVLGENFGPNAVVLVNGVAQKTKNDPDNPATMLIAKKAGKKMPKDAIVALRVQNAGGPASDQFGFFTGRVVTLDDTGKTVNLEVGERFLLVLKKDNYDFTVAVQNESVIKKVIDVDIPQGALGLFEAERPGQTLLTAAGELPCHQSRPACLAPALQVEVNFVVK